MNPNHTFTKEERLCSRKAFDNLLKDGSSLYYFPFRIRWIKSDYPFLYPAQVAFAVPKKRFKRANKRNLIKRRIKEAYRLHKHFFYQFLTENEIRVQLLIVYIGPEILTYHEMEPKIKHSLDQIMVSIRKAAK